MKRLHLASTFILAFAMLVTGCAPDGEATSDADSTAVSDTSGINLTGSFRGPLGLQLYSIRDRMQADVPGTLAWVKQQGFDEVELAGTYGMTPEQFRQELDRAGLEATAMHIGYNMFRDSLESVLDQAEALGVEYVGTASIPRPQGETFTVDMARQAAADFNRWGQAASERGLKFYYHNHGFEFVPLPDSTTAMDVLMAETDPEHVSFEMDVFWVAHPGVDPAALLRKYPERWKLMHVKDMVVGTPVNDYSGSAPAETKAVVGEGQIDWEMVLRAAEESGVQRYYIEDESNDPMGNIPKSIQYLNTINYYE